MIDRKFHFLCGLLTLASLVPSARAASVASDSAADPAYNNGWTNGSNGGFGWGSAWTITTGSGAAVFTGNSAANGDGDTTAPLGDINSPQSSSGRAWGMSADSQSFVNARALRAFNGPLSVGQTFHFQMDNGTVPASSGLYDVLLLNAAGNLVWGFSIRSDGQYEIFAEFGFFSTGIPSSDEGIDVKFTLTSATSWSASIGVLGTQPTVFTGNLFPDEMGQDVSSAEAFVARSGAQPSQHVYFNNFQIYNSAGQVTAVAAVSRKNHNGANHDVNLPLTGAAGIEPRLGGATNDYTLVVTLSGVPSLTSNPQAQVISGTGTVGSGGVANGGIVSVVGNTVTIPLTGVVSQQAIQVRLNAANSAGGIVIPMRVLAGDANGDASVNAGDATVTRNRSGQSTDGSNFRSDYNADGLVNAGDATIVRTRSGQSVP